MNEKETTEKEETILEIDEMLDREPQCSFVDKYYLELLKNKLKNS